MIEELVDSEFQVAVVICFRSVSSENFLRSTSIYCQFLSVFDSD